MPRRLRVEFEGAIYHEMARGNARQKIARDDADRGRLIGGLEQTVNRCGWELVCYVVMGNHLHLLVKTPRPNLVRGLAQWLGLSRADSVPNLTRRVEARLKASPQLSNELAEILRRASAQAAGVDAADAPANRSDDQGDQKQKTKLDIAKRPKQKTKLDTAKRRDGPADRALPLCPNDRGV